MKLAIEHLSKQYRHDLWGLNNFSVEIAPGIIGLLGPNGAGKSTLMRMLATITEPTEGTVKWNDVDIVQSPDTLRYELGYLPQDFGVYPNLTVVEFLDYLAAIKGLDRKSARRRIDELLVLVNLINSAKRPLRSYSGGMKQRVGIAQALLNDPKLLILDEPTVGLDPEERIRFRNLLSELGRDRIIILSTHIVSDVEATATEIIVLDNGQKLEHSTPEQLMNAFDGKVWQWIIPSTALVNLTKRHLVSGAVHRENGIQVRVVSDSAPAPQSRPVLPTIDDVYLYLISNNRDPQ